MALPMATQGELVSELAETTGFPRGEIKHVLEALQNFVVDELQAGNRVKLCGVVIEPKVKAAVKFKKNGARNPATGETVDRKAKPASVKLKARPVAPLTKAKLPSVKKLQNRLG